MLHQVHRQLISLLLSIDADEIHDDTDCEPYLLAPSMLVLGVLLL
jgi:hypothetical protein